MIYFILYRQKFGGEWLGGLFSTANLKFKCVYTYGDPVPIHQYFAMAIWDPTANLIPAIISSCMVMIDFTCGHGKRRTGSFLTSCCKKSS